MAYFHLSAGVSTLEVEKLWAFPDVRVQIPLRHSHVEKDRDPRLVVSTAAFHARVRFEKKQKCSFPIHP